MCSTRLAALCNAAKINSDTGDILAAVAPRVYNPFYGKRHTRHQNPRILVVVRHLFHSRRARCAQVQRLPPAPHLREAAVGVFDDEIARLAEEFGDGQKARLLVKKDHSLVRFYIPPKGIGAAIRESATHVGER